MRAPPRARASNQSRLFRCEGFVESDLLSARVWRCPDVRVELQRAAGGGRGRAADIQGGTTSVDWGGSQTSCSVNTGLCSRPVLFEVGRRRRRVSVPEVTVRELGGIRDGREAGSGVSRWHLQSPGLDRGGRERTGGCGDILSSPSSAEPARAHKCSPSIKPPLRSVAMVTAFSHLSLSLFGSFLLTSLCVRPFFTSKREENQRFTSPVGQRAVHGTRPVVFRRFLMSFLLPLKESFCSSEALCPRNSQPLRTCRPWQLQQEGGAEGAVAPGADHCGLRQSGVPEHRDELTEHRGMCLSWILKRAGPQVEIQGFLPASEVEAVEAHRFRGHNKR